MAEQAAPKRVGAAPKPAGAAPKRAAVLGSPIAHSLSPKLHSAAYAAFGLTDWEYTRFEVAEAQLESFLDAHLIAGEFIGFSLTMPLKYRLVELAGQRSWDIDETARLTGGGNTVVRTPAGIRVYNTDVDGIVRALAGSAPPNTGAIPDAAAGADSATTVAPAAQAATRAVVIGSGATGASAVVALSRLGVTDLTICARNEAARNQLAKLGERLGMRTEHAPLAATDAAGARFIVSTLPAGSVDETTWQWPDDLTGTRILDAAYAQGAFSVGEHAGKLGADFIPGSAMLVEQAVRQWLLFAAAAGQSHRGSERTIAAAMYAALAD